MGPSTHPRSFRQEPVALPIPLRGTHCLKKPTQNQEDWQVALLHLELIHTEPSQRPNRRGAWNFVYQSQECPPPTTALFAMPCLER